MSALTKSKLIKFYKEYKNKWHKNVEAMANCYGVSVGDCAYLVALGKEQWKNRK